MYKKNPAGKQLNLTDPYLNYPKYIREMLHNSWAEYFFKSIFSNINEERFSLLYSNNYSRPNAPVNIMIGLLTLKELNQWSDEELLAAFYFDYRVQYALGISDFDKERICINTIGNFRKRLYEYDETHGRDLLEEEISALTDELIALSGMDTSLARQDSMMISANCKKMGRLELIYTVNNNVVDLLKEHAENTIPKICQHYLEEKDKPNQIYRLKKEEVPVKTEQLLKESLELYEAVPADLQQEETYQSLSRLIEEQTAGDGTTPKKPKEIAPNSLQNPSDPDATYRKKGNKSHTGYVMNFVEARDKEKEMSMIVSYQFEPNIKSDKELGLNALKKDLKGAKTIVSDGAYYSPDVVDKAEEKGINLSYSALTGRSSSDGKLSSNQFEIDAEAELIVACPGGAKPVTATRNRDQEYFQAKFDKKDCKACSLADSCIFKEQKKFNSVIIADKKLVADHYRSLLGTEEHQMLADFRAGAEGIPSVLRRVYGFDDIPVRGLKRSRIWSHFKLMAHNFKSFYSYFKRTGAGPLSLARFFHLLSRWFGFKRWQACYGC